MADYATIPIFPLQIVVFPGEMVPLRIFEERYKQMFADVRAARERGEVLQVGIILVEGSEVLAEVGCTVVLEEVLEEHEDGRLNIITLGARRFRIEQVAGDKSYLEAWVEYVDDEEEAIDGVLQTRVIAGYQRLLELVEEESGAEVEGGDADNAFQIAQAVAVDLGGKQRLLAMTTENRRLEMLGEYFERLLPTLEERRAVRLRVHSNGHSKGS
ncbi:MAG: LON peptidase substrate-binding domain-containing protein [Candidatus Latescibacteria bacterium]|jgi:ATP-dependent Lon protease|nr:LON peptidase substrate-binding domain-containing protein [Candidatus Latescibacterota bacterium]|tara:strand:- start:547 stop:1188 length:642 start_codon:yes stop_codon:yes gene_type:complete